MSYNYSNNPNIPLKHSDCNTNNLQFQDYTGPMQVPMTRQHNLPLKFSDQDPRNSEIENYKTIVRKKRLFISSTNKKYSADLPETFSVVNQSEIKDIRYIKPIQAQISYTATATAIFNGFIYFPDLDASEFNTNGNRYHAYFPVIQGSNGSVVVFSVSFNSDYITEFKKLNKLPNNLRVEVLKENSDGTITPFVELNSFAVELEINYIDHAFKNDNQAI